MIACGRQKCPWNQNTRPVGRLRIMSCWISSGASKPNAARLPIFSDDFLAVFFHLLGASQHRSHECRSRRCRAFRFANRLHRGEIPAGSGNTRARGYASRAGFGCIGAAGSHDHAPEWCARPAHSASGGLRASQSGTYNPTQKRCATHESAHHSVTLRQTRAGTVRTSATQGL